MDPIGSIIYERMDRQLEMENASNARRRDTLCEKESLYYIYTLCFGGMSAAFCFGAALTGWQAFVQIHFTGHVIMKSARSIGRGEATSLDGGQRGVRIQNKRLQSGFNFVCMFYILLIVYRSIYQMLQTRFSSLAAPSPITTPDLPVLQK